MSASEKMVEAISSIDPNVAENHLKGLAGVWDYTKKALEALEDLDDNDLGEKLVQLVSLNQIVSVHYLFDVLDETEANKLVQENEEVLADEEFIKAAFNEKEIRVFKAATAYKKLLYSNLNSLRQLSILVSRAYQSRYTETLK